MEDVKFLDAKKELEKLDDNQLLNVMYNMIEICRKDSKLMYKNVLMLSMEIAFDRKLVLENADKTTIDMLKRQMLETIDEVL